MALKFQRRNTSLLLMVLLVSLTGLVEGAERTSDLFRSVNTDLTAIASELAKVDAFFDQAVQWPEDSNKPHTTRGILPFDVANTRAAESVATVQNKLAQVAEKMAELKEQEQKLRQDRDILAQDRDILAKEKTELAHSERLFAMGFYASLSATAATLFGLIARLPTYRLERRLKALEIEYKEFELQRIRAGEA